MLTETERLDLVSQFKAQDKQYQRYKVCPLCKGDSNSFVVSRRGKSISCWCYRCKKYVKLLDSVPSFRTSLQFAVKQRKQIRWRKNKHAELFTPEPKTDYEVREVWLPSDCTDELPTKAKLWLLRYHITQEEIHKYAIKWSPHYERLILPVHKDGKLVYWTGRYFGNETTQPKYLNLRQEKGNVVFQVGTEASQILVIVEDILSAIAVSRAGYRAIALLGCHLSDSVLNEMQLQGKQATVVLWLDQDKQCTSFKVAKRLEVLGWKGKVVVTPLDPKEYTPDQISHFLKRREHVVCSKSSLEGSTSRLQDDLESHSSRD